jgi:hypothetical protein
MRVARINRVARSAGGIPSPANRIVSITNSAGDALFTIAGPHGLSGTPTLIVSGTSSGTYDGSRVVASTPTATTFTVAGAYTADASGGSWRG